VPIRIVDVSASVNLPWHRKVQKFSSGNGSPGWSRKRAVKLSWCCGGGCAEYHIVSFCYGTLCTCNA